MHYARLTKVSIDEVLPLIRTNNETKNKDRVLVAGTPVKLSSFRLKVFASKGTTCHYCGLRAEFFAIERSLADEEHDRPYHINLWGTNEHGHEVLFTHDHIVARALGGAPSDLNNAVTSCGPCNWEKGKIEGKIVEQMKKNA